MKMTKKIGTISAIGVVALVAGSAWGNNGVQNYTYDDVVGPPGIYVDCLGENITLVVHVTGSYHEFETPSGTYHLLDNWKIRWEVTGLITGRTWVGKGVSPFQWNAGPGETNQWVSRITVKPLTGDGPVFKFENKFKITVNANGELVVDRPFYEDPENVYRCVGKQ